MTSTARRTASLLMACSLTLLACSGSPAKVSPSGSNDSTIGGSVVVFAASSLTEAFGDIGRAFEAAHPGVSVVFNFGGSSELVAQVAQGAPVDVVVTADEANMADLVVASNAAGDPVVIATNTMAMIVEAGNPQQVASVSDLARSDLIVVLCDVAVPCGSAAAMVLDRAGVVVNARSLEGKVKGVVAKVVIGEADAGIVFATDVRAAGTSATGVAIPADINVVTRAPIVVAAAARNPGAAHAFLDFVAGPTAQGLLAARGFGAP